MSNIHSTFIYEINFNNPRYFSIGCRKKKGENGRDKHKNKT